MESLLVSPLPRRNRLLGHLALVSLVACMSGCQKPPADEPVSADAGAAAEPAKTPAAKAPSESGAPAGAKAPAPGDAAALADRDPALARKLVREQGALLLDVRSEKEFSQGHVEGAKLIPHTEVAARIDEIAELQGGDRSKPIVVYCRSGRRSGLAKEALVKAGFTQVSNLGGYTDWCEDC